MEYLSQIIPQIILGLSGAIVSIMGAWAVLVRVRSASSEARQLLIRIWDWIVQAGHENKVPHHLKQAILDELARQEKVDEPAS